jgi:uncharacterized protein (TIGR03437 family)
MGQAPKYTISSVAGTGSSGFTGDGGAANAAQLKFPGGLSFDAAGNMYIADTFNSRIRKVDTGGNISTFAGTGDFGNFGDGNTAAKAGFNRPYGTAVDKAGNIYIADAYNDAIRKVSTSGTVSTVAGNSQRGLGGDGGAATGALVDTPTAVVLDAAGNMYITDTGNNRIRKVDTSGIISTFAGSGALYVLGDDGGPATSAGLNRPEGIAVDAAGNVYISDTFNHLVRKITPDGTIRNVAGNGNGANQGDGGPATKASLYYPKGLAVDRSGNLFIADWLNSRVRVVTPDGTIWTAAGNGTFGYYGDGGPATNASLRFPWGLAVDGANNVYIADDENSTIRMLKPVVTQTSQTPKINAAASAAAFGGFAAVAPGSWIEIHGSHLANHARAWTSADFHGTQAPTSLDGVAVTIGGQAAFVSYVSPEQINAEIPSGTQLGPQEVRVTTPGGTSEAQMITVNEIQPGLLAPAGLMIGGKQYTQAVLADGSTVAAPAGATNEAARPARPGETVVLYGVGFGPVSAGIGAGDVVQQDNSLLLPFQVFFGGTRASVKYAGLAPGTVGLYQFNVVVPDAAEGAAVPLTFALGSSSGEQVLYTAVAR